MANSDKNILITPNKGVSGLTSASFTGAGNSSITLQVADTSTGTLRFSNGLDSIFTIDTNLTNKPILTISGKHQKPIIEVTSSKKVILNQKTSFSGPLRISGKSNLALPQAKKGLLTYDFSEKTIDVANGKVWATCSKINSPIKQDLLYYVDSERTDSYPGSGTTWFDISGNNNHFTLSGGAGPVKGQGINFNGVDGAAEMTLPSPFRGGQSFSWTYNTWFRVNGSPSSAPHHNVIVDTDVTGGSQNGIGVMWGSSSPGWGSNMQVTYNTRPSSGGGYTNLSGRILTLGTWYNVSVVRSGLNFTRLYVNGVLQNTYYGNMPAFGTTLQRIGRWTDGTVYSNTNIAAVGVYTRALTPQEIIYNYESMRDRWGI